MKNADMPAQPIVDSEGVTALFGHENLGAGGLTKREELAARAMIGLIANPEGTGGQFELCARDAVDHADALLAELEKEQSQ